MSNRLITASQIEAFLSNRPSFLDVSKQNPSVFQDTMSWTRVRAEPEPVPRSSHTLTCVGNSLHLLGGYGTSNRSMELQIFDPDSSTWERPMTAGQLPCERYSHSTVVVGTHLIVFGGVSENVWLNDLYVLDTAFKQEFIPTLGAGLGRVQHTASLDIKPQTMLMWYKPSFMGHCPCPRAAHSASVYGTRIVIFGGNDGTRLFNDLHVLDTDTMTWSTPPTQGKTPSPRAGHSANLIGHHLYIFGGNTSDGPHNGLVRLDLESMTWDKPEYMGTPPSARVGHTANLVQDSKILVFGGGHTSGKVFNDLHIFDARTSTWSRPADSGTLPVPRCGHATACVQQTLFFFGGSDADGHVFNDLHCLDTSYLRVPRGPESRRHSFGMRSAEPSEEWASISHASQSAAAAAVVDKLSAVGEHLKEVSGHVRRRIDEEEHMVMQQHDQLRALIDAIEHSRAQQFAVLRQEVAMLEHLISEQLKEVEDDVEASRSVISGQRSADLRFASRLMSKMEARERERDPDGQIGIVRVMAQALESGAGGPEHLSPKFPSTHSTSPPSYITTQPPNSAAQPMSRRMRRSPSTSSATSGGIPHSHPLSHSHSHPHSHAHAHSHPHAHAHPPASLHAQSHAFIQTHRMSVRPRSTQTLHRHALSRAQSVSPPAARSMEPTVGGSVSSHVSPPASPDTDTAQLASRTVHSNNTAVLLPNHPIDANNATRNEVRMRKEIFEALSSEEAAGH